MRDELDEMREAYMVSNGYFEGRGYQFFKDFDSHLDFLIKKTDEYTYLKELKRENYG